MKKESGYEQRLMEYLERNVHPETARNIGHIVATSPLMSAEGAMSIILQMQIDHVRQDAEIAAQEAPILEATDAAQQHFANRFRGVQ